MNDTYTKTSQLAADILDYSDSSLRINLRYLEPAFRRLRMVFQQDSNLPATDGLRLYCDPVRICARFSDEPNSVSRDRLHVALHCLFLHIFPDRDADKDRWNLACDVAVEHLITRLGISSLSCVREVRQQDIVEKIKKKVPKMTAEWIYKYLVESEISPEECREMRIQFTADDHTLWYSEATGTGESDSGTDKTGRQSAQPSDMENSVSDSDSGPDGEPGEESPDEYGGDGTGEDAEDNEQAAEGSGGNSEGPGGGTGGEDDGDHGEEPALTPEELEKLWENVADRVRVDMDTSGGTWGDGAGDMMQALKELKKEKYDYAEFLRRFAVPGEDLRVSDDEFDYNYYTYGMQLYGDMPLIEPLESRDAKKVREFVIALDTSESVSGDIVQKFVTKTWNIMKQSENFFQKVNVHIIQCGARVEEDVKITDQDEFDRYMKKMVLKGFGGTDFRPVFEHVDMLIRQHEFSNLKGMIYFTDGWGTFPAAPPEYDTVFVFLDRGLDLPDVPPWAIRYVLKDTDPAVSTPEEEIRKGAGHERSV